MTNNRLKLREMMGVIPARKRFKQALTAFFGEEDVPRTKFGLSSLSQLHPSISPKLWRGKPYLEKKVIISNLFNHTQTPIEKGWSVQKSQVLDFRGKKLTYNSHNGTDFAIPVGSTVCTAAPGEVVAILSEFNRGGLKIFIDHGEGLMTCSAHLARSLVKIGDKLKRGQAIALSGYSGLDGFTTFPLGIPHVHFNVWLNCQPIDPFPFKEEVSLWRNGNIPCLPDNNEGDFNPSNYNAEKVEEAISICKTQSAQDRLRSFETLALKATHTIIEMNYYPTRFPRYINLYDKDYPRSSKLDLPFKREKFDGVVFLDEIGK